MNSTTSGLSSRPSVDVQFYREEKTPHDVIMYVPPYCLAGLITTYFTWPTINWTKLRVCLPVRHCCRRFFPAARLRCCPIHNERSTHSECTCTVLAMC